MVDSKENYKFELGVKGLICIHGPLCCRNSYKNVTRTLKTMRIVLHFVLTKKRCSEKKSVFLNKKKRKQLIHSYGTYYV